MHRSLRRETIALLLEKVSMKHLWLVVAVVSALGGLAHGADSWGLWSHYFHQVCARVAEGSVDPSAAFETQAQCLAEQRWRHRESLARPCSNIWTGKPLPNCRGATD